MKRIRNLFDRLILGSGKSRYSKYIIHHHEHDSLLNEIKKTATGLFEEQETQLLVDILKGVPHPIMLDIGANIGLMTLNACANIEDVKIYAFEPGPSQFAYLTKNIVENKLTDRVSMLNVALSSREGLIDFNVHEGMHSSADGIVDTGRAGSAQVIQVQSTLLDNWWKNSERPEVRLIKIDTEGGELQILKHARELISKNRPYIVTEMCDINFKNYGLTYQEHLDFFNEIGYHVYDINRKVKIERDTDIPPNQYYFLAAPKEHDRLF